MIQSDQFASFLEGFSLVLSLRFLLFNHIALSLMIILAGAESCCAFLMLALIKYLQAIVVINFLGQKGL